MKRIPLENLANAMTWHCKFYAVEIRRILKVLATGVDEYGRQVCVSFFGKRSCAPQSADAQQYFKLFADFNAQHDIVLATPSEMAQLIKNEQSCPVRTTPAADVARKFLAELFAYRHFYDGKGPQLILPPRPKRPRKVPSRHMPVAKIKWVDNVIGNNANRPNGVDIWNTWQFIHELEMCSETKVRVCPYCNADRIYSLVIEKNGELAVSRSALDHYYAKEEYSYLACSLYNLIPACTRCNSPFKHTYSNNPNGRRLSHPYEDDFDRELRFSWGKKLPEACENNVGPNELVLGLVPRRGATAALVRAEESRQVFHLPEVYTQMYSEEACEVAGVFKKLYSTWTVETLRQLGSEITGMQIPDEPTGAEITAARETVKHLLLHCDFKRQNMNSQSLSKLKIDLMEELENVEGRAL